MAIIRTAEVREAGRVAGGWFTEEAEDDEHHAYRVRRTIFSGSTRFQKMEILDTFKHGKILVLDGKVQSAQADESLYHEALVHPGLMAHPNPRRVLILGGGEGASLREVLKHKTVERAVMVELDPEVVGLSIVHLPEWHRGAFDDPRAQLFIDDGRRWLACCEESFDAVIVDVTDLLDDGPALALYTREFYQLLRRRLAPGGVAVVQGLELSQGGLQGHAVLRATLETVFPAVRSYKTFIPSFWTEWGFLTASDGLDPAAAAPEVLADRLLSRVDPASPLRCYDEEFHADLFRLPRWMRRRLAEEGSVLTDLGLRAPLLPPAANGDV